MVKLWQDLWPPSAAAKTVILYALALAVAASLLQWLQYRYLMRAFSTDIYVGVLALGFIALGVWAGRQLTRRPRAEGFQRNEAALKALGVTAREYEILALLAAGQSNKEMARTLGISPNTVKTHVSRLYEKLDVQRRTQAVEKARGLALIV